MSATGVCYIKGGLRCSDNGHNWPRNILMIWVLSCMMCKCLHCHCNNSLHQEGVHFNRSFQTPHWEEYLQTCILRISMLSVSWGCIVCDVKFRLQTFLRAELFNNIYSQWTDPWHVCLWLMMLISPERSHFLNIDVFSHVIGLDFFCFYWSSPPAH